MNKPAQVLLEHGRTVVDPRLPGVTAHRARAVQTVLLGAAYLAIYVFLDRISFIGPDASPSFVNYAWNPNSGASIAMTIIFGRRIIPFMFVAPLLGDLVVQPFPFSLPFELASGVLIGSIYGAAALFLLHSNRRFDCALQSMSSLVLFTFTIVVSTALVATGYMGMAVASGLVPKGDFAAATLSQWIGDAIGIMVITPLALVLWTRRHEVRMSAETVLQFVAIAVALLLVYAFWTAQHQQPFYILFVPIVWTAVRAGIEGVSVGILATQLGLIAGLHFVPDGIEELPKLQALMLVLALTGLFAGELVTERRRTEAVLRMHQESLARFARLGSVGELAAAVAHELNQPLMAAGTYTRLVDDAICSGNADAKTVADTAKKAVAQVERAAAVVRRLRALVRLDRSNRVACPVDQIVRETINLCQPDLDHVAVTVYRTLAADLPPVMVDILQIEQALLNLVRNSIEAMDGKGVISIEVALAGTDFIEVAVRDSGPGFPPELVANPFLPLSSTKKEGLGIGLTLCRSLIEAHGGRIWLDTNSLGAAIHFTLPIAKLAVVGLASND